jgi:hypothetical protein
MIKNVVIVDERGYMVGSTIGSGDENRYMWHLFEKLGIRGGMKHVVINPSLDIQLLRVEYDNNEMTIWVRRTSRRKGRNWPTKSENVYVYLGYNNATEVNLGITGTKGSDGTYILVKED